MMMDGMVVDGAMAVTAVRLESRAFEALMKGIPLASEEMDALMGGARREVLDEALWRAVNRNAATAAEYAAKEGAIRFLAAHGASMSYASEAGVTLMGAVLRTMDVGALRALLEAGASPDSPVHLKEPRTSALCAAMYRARNGREGKLRQIEMLLEFGADPMHRGDRGETVLEEAVEHAGDKALGMLVANASERGRLDVATIYRLWELAIHREAPEKLRILLVAGRGAFTRDAMVRLVMLASSHPAYYDCIKEIRDAAMRRGVIA